MKPRTPTWWDSHEDLYDEEIGISGAMNYYNNYLIFDEEDELTHPLDLTYVTSNDGPLVVDYLDPSLLKVVGCAGTLGISIAPGRCSKQLGYSRNLGNDAHDLKNYDTHTVVSMLMPYEYEMLGVEGYFQAMSDHGIKVLTIPIVDVSIPRGNLRLFRKTIKEIINRLRMGKNVVLHCRGGKGRAGLVAACTLVELGYSPELSIHLVRRYRQGAIETREQEDFVYDYADNN